MIRNFKFALNIILVFFLLFISGNVFSQQTTSQREKCGHNKVLSIQKQNNPAFQEAIDNQNQAIQDYIQTNLTPGSTKAETISQNATHIIPVVVHIVRDPSDPVGPISYAQVESQIDALNAAYSKSYPNYNGQSHGPSATDTKIQFCLAQNPSGPASWTYPSEPGVMRYNDAVRANNQLSIPSTNDLLSLTHPTQNHFPFGNFLNIWLVKSIDGLCSGVQGYSVHPIGPQVGINGFSIDGIVLRADVFGDNSPGNNFTLQPHDFYGLNCPSSYAGNDEGKVAVHEVGHYLNLFHTFQNDINSGAACAGGTSQTCSTQGDFVCDTPPCQMFSTYNCTDPIPNSCGNPIMVEDYMYYSSDACLNTFTQGQTDRMIAHLNLYRPNLFSVENQVNTGIRGSNGCIAPELIAEFTYSGNNCINTPHNLEAYSSASINTATSFLWSSNAGVIADPTAANTSITFNSAGTYTVTLTVDDGGSPISTTQTIAISNCQLNPDFQSQSQWYFGQYAQVDFSSGPAIPTNIARINETVFAHEATYSYVDTNGNLLFYMDGQNLWDGSHNQLNSSPLFSTAGSTWNSVNSQSQPTISVHGMTGVPYPGHPNEFFLFCAPSIENYSNFNAVQVEWIHVNLNDSSITSPQPLSFMPNRKAECLTTVPHCNGRDHWIITHEAYPDGNRFHTYLVTSLGIAPENMLQQTFDFETNDGCQLKGSPNNDKLVLSGGPAINGPDKDIATYSFDNITGVISNEVIYDYPAAGQFNGCSFSRDGQQIYAANNTGEIVQFDVQSGTSTLISNQGSPLYLQLGPDDNLYVATGGDEDHMGRIVNPDTPNNVGSFDPNAIDFSSVSPSGVISKISIPHYPDGIQPDPIPLDFSVVSTSCLDFDFEIDPCWSSYDISWDFGDGSPVSTGTNVSHSYTASGNYQVTCSLSRYGIQDSIHIQHTVQVNNGPLSITGNSTSCVDNVNPTTYNAPFESGATYNWTVSTEGNFVSPNGGAQIDVDWVSGATGIVGLSKTKDGCTLTDSAEVTLEFCSLGVGDELNELGFKVYPNPTQGTLNVQIQDHKKIAEIRILNALGQVVNQYKIKDNYIMIDVEDDAGVYFLEVIKTDATQKTVKVIKYD